METETVLLVGALIGIGLYNTYLLTVLSTLKEQYQSAAEAILSMAEELESLGSKNVQIFRQ